MTRLLSLPDNLIILTTILPHCISIWKELDLVAMAPYPLSRSTFLPKKIYLTNIHHLGKVAFLTVNSDVIFLGIIHKSPTIPKVAFIFIMIQM